ncbi:MAG: zinc carboxypeptidase [Bdellovibrionales bacterium CG10_big_fil_rev_8_21_14_0_10_45_34]|nr:MAG: zinc carboxypeptidase [Bdellovibrionales bacterium CG10_big_fil_rev_8_21_14_0_10_45_34]
MSFFEYDWQERLVDDYSDFVKCRTLAVVKENRKGLVDGVRSSFLSTLSRVSQIDNRSDGIPEYQVKGFEIIGDQSTHDESDPVFVLIGGVHGLERIGSQVVLSYIESLFNRMGWDDELISSFNKVKFLSIPILNPVGIHSLTRSNGNGVDLMRNAPVDSDEASIFPIAGHRTSPRLPYYRGKLGAPMEAESQALVDFVFEHIKKSRFVIALDVHSGFGARDRLWYPHAKTTKAFEKTKEALHLMSAFEGAFKNHVYLIEPQSKSYTTHGDLWDYLYELYSKENPTGLFLPWTLEMGSWMWIRKNPRQLFNASGIFDPILPHRKKRILRRHMPLLDFFLKAGANHSKIFRRNAS